MGTGFAIPARPSGLLASERCAPKAARLRSRQSAGLTVRDLSRLRTPKYRVLPFLKREKRMPRQAPKLQNQTGYSQTEQVMIWTRN